MFNKEGYVEYVGEASGGSYSAGLRMIESTYDADIDAEYTKDKCESLLKRIQQDDSQTKKWRSDRVSHLRKYVEYKGNATAMEQRKLFVSWMQNQPRRDDPDKKYSIETINGAADKLQSGLKKLGVSKYAEVNCFTITDSEYFAALYKACYAHAEASDKKQGHRDFRNGLDFYMQFLNKQNNTNITPTSPVKEKIKYIIDTYKANFETVDEGERYKWIAVEWYKKHWDIEAENFGEMVATAFSKAENLLTSGMYYAYKMLTDYASLAPEKVRSLFRTLHNEELPLAQRYAEFQNGFKEYVADLQKQNGKSYNHYQDLHAISVYLYFEYPEKYYIYKSTMYTNMRDRIGFVEEKAKQKSLTWKVESHIRLCELILEEIQNDDELKHMSGARLDDTCYKDPEYHLLAMDIAFYGAIYMSENDFGEVVETVGVAVYWPTLDEYNPNISAEEWKEFLTEDSKTYPSTLKMLKAMLELGGEATCKKLSEVLGGHPSSCVSRGNTLGQRAKKKYNLPPCMDGDKERFFPVPFIGHEVIEDGKKLYAWKLRTELEEALKNMDLDNIVTDESTTDVELNTILYGPPGTGKTYHTAIYAVAIIENKELAEVEQEDYAEVLVRYNEYKTNGRIAFTTFHQAYGYEEFIEGIKPVVTADDNDGKSDVQYDILPGVFKNFCATAKNSGVEDYKVNPTPNIWKVSLYSTGDNPIRTECLNNNHIRIGWGDSYGKDIMDQDFSKKEGGTVLNAFFNRMQLGDIVVSCYDQYTVDAIGVVSGKPEWNDSFTSFKWLRNVQWIVKNIREDITEITSGTAMTLSSVYRLSKVSLDDVYKIIQKHSPLQPSTSTQKGNYVFIIDEINRGNISKIFGELITLIEPSKRLGEDEELEVILPYSGKPFGVPNNIYIIGTMNTADRSIATIDTALRRRFYFKEMLPNPNVLKDVYVEDISISELLDRINKRITVLYDREHTIGHAYFMALKASPTIDALAKIFENNIIPLLQEYFYEDYEKIRLVLGDNKKEAETQFVVAKSNDYAELFGNVDIGLDDRCSYEINKKAFDNIEAYRSI